MPDYGLLPGPDDETQGLRTNFGRRSSYRDHLIQQMTANDAEGPARDALNAQLDKRYPIKLSPGAQLESQNRFEDELDRRYPPPEDTYTPRYQAGLNQQAADVRAAGTARSKAETYFDPEVTRQRESQAEEAAEFEGRKASVQAAHERMLGTAAAAESARRARTESADISGQHRENAAQFSAASRAPGLIDLPTDSGAGAIVAEAKRSLGPKASTMDYSNFMVHHPRYQTLTEDDKSQLRAWLTSHNSQQGISSLPDLLERIKRFTSPEE